jgi:hypothetical protein
MKEKHECNGMEILKKIPSNIIDKESSSGTTVVAAGDRTEGLLTGLWWRREKSGFVPACQNVNFPSPTKDLISLLT